MARRKTFNEELASEDFANYIEAFCETRPWISREALQSMMEHMLRLMEVDDEQIPRARNRWPFIREKGPGFWQNHA